MERMMPENNERFEKLSGVCTWSEFKTMGDHENKYQTSCYYMLDVSRTPFQMNYCCYCAREVKIVNLKEEKDEPKV